MRVAGRPLRLVRDERGVSLLEMLVALVVLGIAMSGGLALLGRPDTGNTLEADAGRLVRALSAAHADAIRTGAVTHLVLDVRAKAFSYPSSAQPEALSHSTSVEVRGAEELTSGHATRLVFRPDGTSSGATVALRDAAGGEIVLRVHWLDGRPRLIRKDER